MRLQHPSLLLALSALVSMAGPTFAFPARARSQPAIHSLILPRGIVDVGKEKTADADADLAKMKDPKLEKWLYDPKHKFVRYADINALEKYVAKKQSRLLRASEETKDPKYSQEIRKMTKAWGAQQPKEKELRDIDADFKKLTDEVNDEPWNKEAEEKRKKAERAKKKNNNEAAKKKKKTKWHVPAGWAKITGPGKQKKNHAAKKTNHAAKKTNHATKQTNHATKQKKKVHNTYFAPKADNQPPNDTKRPGKIPPYGAPHFKKPLLDS